MSQVRNFKDQYLAIFKNVFLLGYRSKELMAEAIFPFIVGCAIGFVNQWVDKGAFDSVGRRKKRQVKRNLKDYGDEIEALFFSMVFCSFDQSFCERIFISGDSYRLSHQIRICP
ncbi:hypothetical protein PPERSA_12208 [Pseudocohnilembus persalinus]|uniref:Uncharacterized protein n=1 Tax=Pseudocohnilembus persalinus TaxID=266149 RepID=A0A0V0R8Q5_PSEPJ|nr:hypothetical protein PPERSA_12208 [Pseudocohnilembus persalinus]|eukprot:KRX10857.1 hypothetical protein PPERSA_12208 [Pseudocohnilembus persalinus]